MITLDFTIIFQDSITPDDFKHIQETTVSVAGGKVSTDIVIRYSLFIIKWMDDETSFTIPINIFLTFRNYLISVILIEKLEEKNNIHGICQYAGNSDYFIVLLTSHRAKRYTLDLCWSVLANDMDRKLFAILEQVSDILR